MSLLPGSLKEYTYAFDEASIAHFPPEVRGDSKLLVVRKNPSAGEPRFEDLKFSDLPDLVRRTPALRDQLWVRNLTRVAPARIYAHRASGSRHELVLTEKISALEWHALIRNVARMKFPETLTLEGSDEKIIVLAPGHIKFATNLGAQSVATLGRVPLPPYIRRQMVESDRERYQTVWAEGEALSSAAPTASLHFSENLWTDLQYAGVKSTDAFLHVGRGTFEPLRTDQLNEGELHAEAFTINKRSEATIVQAPAVCAIGTTACRLTETLAHLREQPDFARTFSSCHANDEDLFGETKLFIRPGYEFLKVKSLLTNFHLPESSLFVLVAVFAGSLGLAQEAYAHALKKNYRLFSYGDATLWL